MKRALLLSCKNKYRDEILTAFKGAFSAYGSDIAIETCLDERAFEERANSADAVFACEVLSPAFESPSALSMLLRKKLSLHTSIRRLGSKYIVSDALSGSYFGENGYKLVAKFGRAAFDSECFSELEIERTARVAYELAQKQGKKLKLIDRANMLLSHKLWRKIVADINEDYPSVSVESEDVTTALAGAFASDGDGVILAPSLVADILSASMCQSGFEALVGDSTQAAYFLVGDISALPAAVEHMREDAFSLTNASHI